MSLLNNGSVTPNASELLKSSQSSHQAPAPKPHAAMNQPVVTDVSETAAVPQRSKLPLILGGMLLVWGVAIGGFLVFAILFPPLYTIAKRSPLYDGLRHFLFLVPMVSATLMPVK